MAATCSLFYGSRLNFGGEFWLYYPIDKTEVPILYKLEIDKRFLNDRLNLGNPKQKGGLGVGKSLGGNFKPNGKEGSN